MHEETKVVLTRHSFVMFLGVGVFQRELTWSLKMKRISCRERLDWWEKAVFGPHSGVNRKRNPCGMGISTVHILN